jgi:dTDP-glucose pyrophosphorylase
MWGLIPAAGMGSRIQPLAFSKELLPVGSRLDGDRERPRAVSEYLIDRMLRAGADKLCFIISPGKSDILEYYGSGVGHADVCYVIQPEAGGLCDALFRARAFINPDEPVLIGLPDTIWFPENAYLPALTPDGADCNLVLFPVQDPSAFDAVVCDEVGYVKRVEVKSKAARSNWIWGAVTATGDAFHRLKLLWDSRHRSDEYLGDLLNAFIAAGNVVRGRFSGELYMDVGTLEGYRNAQDYLRALGRRSPRVA